MSKPSVSSAAPVAVAEPETLKTQTNWDIFNKLNWGVKRVVCHTLPGRPSDEACKTALIPTAKNIINHLHAGHGGGFMLTIRDQGAKVWPGWNDLAAAGVEIAFVQSQVTDRLVDFADARDLKTTLKPHQGKFRGAWQAFNHQLLFNLYIPTPESAAPSDTDDNEFDE